MPAPAPAPTEKSDGTAGSATPAKRSEGNIAVAGKLRDYAELLDQQGADGFRSRACRRAADVVAALDRPVEEILMHEGREGLVALPAIGTGIAGAIAEMITTGKWSQLERLRGELVPEALFRTIPGIGPQLARRLAEDGQLESLEDLEDAAHRKDLVVRGFGPRRREMIAAVLARRLGRPAFARGVTPSVPPPVALILQVDRMYREKAAAGQLRKIAPKRFNPKREVWLPILHARHEHWHFTALYSNTKLAHELGKTRDWVVIYFQAEGEPEGRCTIVTEARGPLAGKRVVRGRENEQEKETRQQ